MEGEKRNVWTKGGVWAQKDVFEFLRVDLCPLSCVRGRNCCAWLAACVYLWVSVCERLKRVAGGVCYQHSAVGVWGGQGWDEGRNWKGRTGGVCPVGGSRSRDTSLQYTHSLLLLTSRALTHTHIQLSLNELNSLTKKRRWSFLMVMSGFMMLQSLSLSTGFTWGTHNSSSTKLSLAYYKSAQGHHSLWAFKEINIFHYLFTLMLLQPSIHSAKHKKRR